MSKFSHFSHGEADQNGHAHPDIARDGKGKRNSPVAFHSGMTKQQQDMAGVGGMGHPTVVDGGNAAAPLPHAYSARPDLKRGKAVAVHPSHSRGAVEDDAMRQLGDAVLRQARLHANK
jgi:hypothetical protein